MMRRRTFVDAGRRLRRHAPGAEARHGREAQRRQARRRPALRGRVASGQEERGRGADADGQQGQAVEADQRGGLHQPEVLAERHAGAVPGKAGEEMAAQPFADGQAEGEGEDAPGVGHPEQAGEREAEGREEGEQRRQAQDPEGQGPGELVRLDQEGGAEPPEPGHEIAEAPEPAQQRRRLQTGAQRDGPSFTVPSRSQTAGASDRTSAGRNPKGGMASAPTAPAAKADEPAAPSPGEDDAIRQAASFGGGAFRARRSDAAGVLADLRFRGGR